ncbi:MAG TPA: hypothetical protein VIL20_17930 [Sandaracinaceae bacterium]
MSRAFVSTCVLSLVCALDGVAAAQDQEAVPPDEGAGTVEVAASAEVEPSPAPDAASVAAGADVGGATDEAEAGPSSSSLAAQLRAREEIASIHRAFGVATWASMAITAVLGWIQFADEYGFHGSEAETACANNTAVFQDFCTGVPWAHAIAGFTTAALYFTTAGLSLAMPAPLEPSADVELHKTLRWFHLATMLATAAFGIVTANVDADFGTRQALALVHQGLAVTTFGLLTAAAAVIVF